MSGRGGGYHHPLVERVGYHLARIRAWARRVTAPGLSVRMVIWLSGSAALVLAPPAALRLAAVALIAAALAVLPAGFPHTSVVALVELLAIGAVAVSVAADQLPLWMVLVIGGLLYLHHTAAALGAQLRTDAVIPPAVLRYWARRTGLVLANSLLLMLGIVVLAGQAPAGWATGYLALGAAAAVAITAHLASSGWRRHGM
jgi:hypothetical protein